MQTVMKVVGMSCDSCARSVTRALEAVPGVQLADVRLSAGEAAVTYDAAQASLADLQQAVLDAGFELA
jgi:copper chaperone CopZ